MEYTIEIRCQGKLVESVTTTDREEFYDKADTLFDKHRLQAEKEGFEQVHGCWGSDGSLSVGFNRKTGEARALTMKIVQNTGLKDVDGNDICVGDNIALVGDDSKPVPPVYELSMSNDNGLYLWRIDRHGDLEYDVTAERLANYRKVDDKTVECLKLKK